MTSLLREINYRYIMDWAPFDVDELMWEWAFHDFWTQVGIAYTLAQVQKYLILNMR